MNNINLNKIYGSNNKSSDALKLSSITDKFGGIAKYSPLLLTAAAIPANAEVTCTDAAPFTVSGSYFTYGYAGVDLNGDGIDDFNFYAATSFYSGAAAGIFPVGSNQWVGTSAGTVSNLSSGANVGPTAALQTGVGTLAFPFYYGYYYFGQFVPGGSNGESITGFVGVEFDDADGENHYGWINLTVQNNGFLGTPAGTVITLNSWCWEACSDRDFTFGTTDLVDPSIAVGATTGGAMCEEPLPVPTVGEWGLISLALLLLSFGTLMLYRKEGKLAIKRVKS